MNILLFIVVALPFSSLCSVDFFGCRVQKQTYHCAGKYIVTVYSFDSLCTLAFV